MFINHSFAHVLPCLHNSLGTRTVSRGGGGEGRANKKRNFPKMYKKLSSLFSCKNLFGTYIFGNRTRILRVSLRVLMRRLYCINVLFLLCVFSHVKHKYWNWDKNSHALKSKKMSSKATTPSTFIALSANFLVPHPPFGQYRQFRALAPS